MHETEALTVDTTTTLLMGAVLLLSVPVCTGNCQQLA